MVTVTIAKKQAMAFIGAKTWISGTDNQQFANFWSQQHQSGNVARLAKFGIEKEKGVTKSEIIGLSDTTKEPKVREFYFYIAVEIERGKSLENNDFELIEVAAYTWAIFTENENSVESLLRCEMFCWTEWLPKSDYIHDFGPEMEVYFKDKIEYWIPISKKQLTMV